MGGAGAGVDSGSTTPGGGGGRNSPACRPAPSSPGMQDPRPWPLILPAPPAQAPSPLHRRAPNLGFLSQDELCGPFWHLVLAQRWMGRLKAVAGSQMQSLLEAVNTEIHFVTLCAFQVSPELGRQLGERVKCLPRAYLLEISLATHGWWGWNPSPPGGPHC